jgi:hypothetical protein
MPELLRVKAQLLLQSRHPHRDAARTCLTQSLDWSRRQSAQSWHARAAADLDRM